MKRVVIIGSGPAGISAALYLLRAGIDTTVISMNKGALERAHLIENYYGLPKAISGEELYNNGINQAKALGAKFVEDEVFSIEAGKSFEIICGKASYGADGVIIATGSDRSKPKIDGIDELMGKGVSYCAICDAFFFRNKDVCVLGSGEYALHEAWDIENTAKSVTILTNSETPTADFPKNYRIITDKISALSGDGRLNFVIFENGEEIKTDGLFVAIGVAGSTALARKLGAVVENGKIRVDENMKTSVKRVYAAGDCTGGLLQVSKAVYEGAMAATRLIADLKEED